MKTKFNRLNVSGLVLVIVILITILGFTNKKEENKKEFLFVKVITNLPKVSGVYIHHQDKATEVLSMPSIISEKSAIENGEIVAKAFDKLFQEGWKIDHCVGGDQLQRFFLVKE